MDILMLNVVAGFLFAVLNILVLNFTSGSSNGLLCKLFWPGSATGMTLGVPAIKVLPRRAYICLMSIVGPVPKLLYLAAFWAGASVVGVVAICVSLFFLAVGMFVFFLLYAAQRLEAICGFA